VLEPTGGFVRERPITVVDVKDVVGHAVVGDVDVGPPISIHVGDDNA
jgi:hypothetical protein